MPIVIFFFAPRLLPVFARLCNPTGGPCPASKRVIECELHIQHYWWSCAKSLPSESEEVERARRQSWSNYWRRAEMWAMESSAREWAH